jgi:hypothetical protein
VRGWGVDYYDAMVDAILEDQPATKGQR